MKTGIELIAKERQEQIEKHGRTVEQDVALNTSGQLMYAVDVLKMEELDINDCPPPSGWDSGIWIKMISKPLDKRLIIAGAFMAAEYDRLKHTK